MTNFLTFHILSVTGISIFDFPIHLCCQKENPYFQCFLLALHQTLNSVYFQTNMDIILNELKEEVKEETEEEKIDIKNHFLPTISSCEEDNLPR